MNTDETHAERTNRIMSDYITPGLGVLMSEDDIQWLAEQAQKLHSAPDVVAELTSLADQLTELVTHLRTAAQWKYTGADRADGLDQGITMIRERAALLRSQAERGTSPS